MPHIEADTRPERMREKDCRLRGVVSYTHTRRVTSIRDKRHKVNVTVIPPSFSLHP